ncbi:hypothetical protein [Aeromonas sp. AE23HZ002T15]
MRINFRQNLKIESLVAIITVLAIPLFLVGQYFDMGYYSRFGLPVDLFERSIYQILSNTILVVAYFFSDVRNHGDTNWSLLVQFLYFGICYLIISFTCWYVFFLAPVDSKPERINGIGGWASKSKRARERKEEKDKFAIEIILIFVKVLSASIFLFFSIIIPASTFSYGQELAGKEIEKNKTFVCDSESEIYQVLSIDGKLESSGIYVMSSPNALVIWNKGAVEVFPMNQFRYRVVKCDTASTQ